MTKSRDKGLVCLDPERLERACARLGLSRTRLADDAEIARNTVARAFRGLGVFKDTALRIATRLGYDDPNALIGSATTNIGAAASAVCEWELAEYLGPWVTASNQLQYRLCRMQHLYLPDCRGRGKCYDLLNPATRESQRLRACLLRHPTVCNRIGCDPRIPVNLGTWPAPDGHVWWVVDRWVEGRSLDELLKSGDFSTARTAPVLMEIALALQTLHRHNIVFRELSPARVLLADNEAVTLTDFELARLLEAAPTVSADWLDDPYRAPEIECGESSVQADIYSWARIALQLSLGSLPTHGTESIAAASACRALPAPVRRLLVESLSIVPQNRPRNLQSALHALQKHCKTVKGAK